MALTEVFLFELITVHHGRYFSIPPAPPPPNFLPTPAYTSPPTPVSGQSPDSPKANSNLVINGTSPVTKALEEPVKIHPYVSFGFKIADAVVYISDVSFIPDDTWALLEAPEEGGSKRAYPVFVVDCLRFNAHISHYGLKEAVEASRRLGARRNYLTGLGHEIAHEEYIAMLEPAQLPIDVPLPPVSNKLDAQKISHGRDLVGRGDPLWIRPSFDGLRVFVQADGSVTDTGY